MSLIFAKTNQSVEIFVLTPAEAEKEDDGSAKKSGSSPSSHKQDQLTSASRPCVGVRKCQSFYKDISDISVTFCNSAPAPGSENVSSTLDSAIPPLRVRRCVSLLLLEVESNLFRATQE